MIDDSSHLSAERETLFATRRKRSSLSRSVSFARARSPLGNRGNRPGDFSDGPKRGIDHVSPRAAGKAKFDTLSSLTLAAYNLANALQLLGHAVVGGNDFIEGICDLSFKPKLVARHSTGTIASTHRQKGIQELVRISRVSDCAPQTPYLDPSSTPLPIPLLIGTFSHQAVARSATNEDVMAIEARGRGNLIGGASNSNTCASDDNSG
jgi:hypothetical protein